MSELDDLVDDEVVVTDEPDKGEKPAETPSADETQAETVPIAALMAERQKRQEAEAKLAAAEQPGAPSIFDDEEGAIDHLKSEISQTILSDRINLSRDLMIGLKDDYEKQEAVFMTMAEKDPELKSRMTASANPAKFAYDTAVKQKAWEEIQDVDAYKERIKAEILAEMKAAGDDIPDSLASMPADSGADNLPDDSLEAIFSR